MTEAGCPRRITSPAAAQTACGRRSGAELAESSRPGAQSCWKGLFTQPATTARRLGRCTARKPKGRSKSTLRRLGPDLESATFPIQTSVDSHGWVCIGMSSR